MNRSLFFSFLIRPLTLTTYAPCPFLLLFFLPHSSPSFLHRLLYFPPILWLVRNKSNFFFSESTSSKAAPENSNKKVRFLFFVSLSRKSHELCSHRARVFFLFLLVLTRGFRIFGEQRRERYFVSERAKQNDV